MTEGVQPTLRFDYKRTKVKQYFKLARALRTETTLNDAYDYDPDPKGYTAHRMTYDLRRLRLKRLTNSSRKQTLYGAPRSRKQTL